MTSTRFAAVCAILLLYSISISCSCVEKYGNVDLGLIRERRRATNEDNTINNTVGEVRTVIKNSREGFFKSFDLTKTARRLLPSAEDLKNICRKYIGSYDTAPTTEAPEVPEQSEYQEILPEVPSVTDATPLDDNETIAEDHVEDDEDDQGGKVYGPYGYYGYYPGYHHNYGVPPGFSNGYYQSGGGHPGGPGGHGSGYPPVNYGYPGYGPPGMRPGYGMNPGYGMSPGYGQYPGGYPGYNMGPPPGYAMPPAPYMPPRPSGGHGRPPSHGSRPPPMMGPGYVAPPAMGVGHPSRPNGNRPPPPHTFYTGQGYPPSNGAPLPYPYQESDAMYGKPPQNEESTGGNITYPPGYLGNSCSVHESDSPPNTYGSMYGHSLYPNQKYPPYYAHPYGPPQQNRALRPLPTLAYTFCQYLVGKEEEKQE